MRPRGNRCSASNYVSGGQPRLIHLTILRRFSWPGLALCVHRAGALMQWLKLPALKVGDRGFEPHSGLKVSNKQNVSSPLTRKDSILWGDSERDREVACSASDSQGSNIEFCVWRAASSHSSNYLQEVLLAKLSLHVHKGGPKRHSFHLFLHIKLCSFVTIISRVS